MLKFFKRFAKKSLPSSWFLWPIGTAIGTSYYSELYQYYLSVPELNTVINLRARAFSSAKVVATKPSDERYLQLFQNPNWYQTSAEFMRTAHIQRLIYGNEFIYLLRPFGVTNGSSVYALYVLPSQSVRVKQDSREYYLLNQPTVTYTIGTRQLERENVLHFVENRTPEQLTGESPVVQLRCVLDNIARAYESRGVIIKSRGALGILYNNAKDAAGMLDFTEEEQKRIQEQYRNNYGLLSNQNQLIMSNKPLGYIQMNVSPDRLGLFEEAKDGLAKILDRYGVPADLLVREKGATYENQRQAEKGFFIRTIIPEANEWIAGFNSVFGTSLKLDYSHLHVFNDELKIQSEMLKSRIEMLSLLLRDGIITAEEYRAEVNKFLTI
jgi:HK97 family phage portal protein